MKWNAGDIELAVARCLYNPRTYLLLTNVSWGLGVHECDLLAMSGARYLTEIEIKVSVNDCRRDLSKRHHHDNVKIKYLYFAVPDTIVSKCLPYIPERAGIIAVTDRGQYLHARRLRPARAHAGARPLSEFEVSKLQRLGCIRYWFIREQLQALKNGREKR